MPKKSNKTTHVLNLLTNREMVAEDDTLDADMEAELENFIINLPSAETLLNDDIQAVKTETKDEPQELSDIIRAQLEVIAEKEEAELAATVSKLNLEYFDEEDKIMYHYTNVVEDIVKVKVLETMREMNVCTCEKCVSDVIALTLNSLPPKYVVTEKGNLFSKLAAYENQYSTDVTSAIVQACIAVNKIPRH